MHKALQHVQATQHQTCITHNRLPKEKAHHVGFQLHASLITFPDASLIAEHGLTADVMPVCAVLRN